MYPYFDHAFVFLFLIALAGVVQHVYDIDVGGSTLILRIRSVLYWGWNDRSKGRGVDKDAGFVARSCGRGLVP